MNISQKIDKLIEEATNQEIRYLIDAPGFDKLANPNSLDQRTDWYFDNYRIRHHQSKGRDNFDNWQKIQDSQAGQIHKKKTPISPQKEKELDRDALFRIVVYSKRPEIDGKELYLEKVKIFKNGKFIGEFITTETEGVEDERNVKLLTRVPGIQSVKRLGPVSLKSIVKGKIK
jgi:hypothetical protein